MCGEEREYLGWVSTSKIGTHWPTLGLEVFLTRHSLVVKQKTTDNLSEAIRRAEEYMRGLRKHVSKETVARAPVECNPVRYPSLVPVILIRQEFTRPSVSPTSA